jgi:WD40 repeat protein
MNHRTPSQMRCGSLTLAILLLFHISPAATPALAGNGKIAFESSRNSNWDIYVMDANGSNTIRLTNHTAADVNPAWSPDRTKIAFVSSRAGFGNDEIYVMDANGSNPIRLTDDPAGDYEPAWSPDGTRIAFGSTRDGNNEIYVMDADGSNPIRLTNHPASDYGPTWSPDGTKIAFASDRDGNVEIYVMNTNGSGQVNLTNDPADDADPTWSPDGAKIAFETIRDGNQDIFAMDADGSNQTRLTNDPSDDFGPAWSPDGTRIAFGSSRIGNAEIYVMDANGSNETRLTIHSAFDAKPDWERLSAFPTPTATPGPSGTPTTSPTTTPTGTPTATPMPSATPTPNPTTTPTGTPTVPPTATPGSTPLPTPIATPTPAVTPTATPTPTPSRPEALNISTRMRVESGNNVLIGGFIITGNVPKTVAVRGIGPSLALSGIAAALNDPTLELRAANGALLSQNDDWQGDPASASQLTALGLALQNPKESGIVATLQPGNSYTAILAGQNGGTGVGLVEIYDTNAAAGAQLANISTRGFVQTGDNVMIGGFILGGDSGDTRMVVRGIGPSLAQFGLSPVLTDPTLELHDGNGALLISNDDWQNDPTSAGQLIAVGLAPQDSRESGIFTSIPPGAFTAILAGGNGGTGIGLVEIYNLH